MTIQEVSIKFGYSESSLKTQFKRTAAAIQKKYNVMLLRYYDEQGKLCYEVEDGRAETFFDEDEGRKVNIGRSTLKFQNFQFTSFLGIVMTPMGVFRGTREDFLKYIGVRKNKKNLEVLQQSLKNLADKKYIAFHEDGKRHIVVYVTEETEETMKIGSKMIKRCRDICKKHNKTTDKVTQLLKVWLAVQICALHQPFTNADIGRLTGLSNYQIRDALKMFKGEQGQDDIFRTWRIGDYYHCQGRGVDIVPWNNEDAPSE